MKFEDRWYQIEAEDALLKCVLETPEQHPVIAIPTGGGKTKIIASFISKLLEIKPTWNVLVVSHTEDIVKQDFDAIAEYFPGISIGLYSSGLNSRTIRKITVAGIQSIYRVSNRLTMFDVVIIDEAHAVPVKGAGMYRSLFNRMNCIRIGVSATIFRTGHGYIHEGEGAMFTTLVYDLTSLENFNRLVDQGYLTKLYTKSTLMEMNADDVSVTGGDYNQKDLSDKFDKEEITNAAVDETVQYGKRYKKWLVFAIDTAHADRIRDQLVLRGIEAVSLHSNSPGNRTQIIDDFKNGTVRAIVSVGMITTGFDAPNVDLIVLLRPTMSPVLHVQMPGRGLRICEGKDHCLVLDFAQNTKRLGPINDVQIPKKGKRKKLKAPVKTCPTCTCIIPASLRICNVCGHEFIFECKLTTKASDEEIVRRRKEKKVPKEEWHTVTNVFYYLHQGSGRPDSLRVSYQLGMTGAVSEFICYDHPGKIQYSARKWVADRLALPKMPPNVAALMKCIPYLRAPRAILVDKSARWPQIKNYAF